MCATADGGALMRVNTPSADTTATLSIYGDSSSKVTAFARAATNTYVFVPKATLEGGQRTITLTTSPDVGSSVKVSNKSLCSQTLTLTNSVTDQLGRSTAGTRLVTITGTGAMSGFTTTVPIERGGSASITLPATVADGSTSANPSGGYSFNLTAPTIAGARSVSISPSAVTSTYAGPKASAVLAETYRASTLSISSSSPNGVTAGTPVDLTIALTDADNSGLVTLKDGEKVLGTCVQLNGSCGLNGVSFDHSGNHLISASYSFVDDGQSIVSPVFGQLVTPAAAVSSLGTPVGVTTSQSATIRFQLAELGGTVECRIDENDWAPCTSVDGIWATMVVDHLADGSHTESVRQTDELGNISPVHSTAPWTVDTTAPASPGISSNRLGTTNLRSASFTLTGEPGASFQCRLDSGSWVSCQSPKSFPYLSLGAHTVFARQIDRAGNVSDPTSISWTIAQLKLTKAATLDLPEGPTVNVRSSFRATGFAYSGESSGAGRLAYEWQRCLGTSVLSCRTISAADSYLAAPADLGFRIRLIKTFTSSDGAHVSSATPMSGVVVPFAIDRPTVVISDSLEVPAVGHVLTATTPIWQGFPNQPAGSQISYRWERCSATVEESCTSIFGATKPTYTASKYEIGKRLLVRVGVTVGFGLNRKTVWTQSSATGVVTRSSTARTLRR